MKPKNQYYFGTDVLEYLSAKGIKYKQVNISANPGNFRINITKKREGSIDPGDQVTAFPLTNNYLESMDDLGFTAAYLQIQFKKIRNIEDYKDFDLRLSDLTLKTYNP